MMRNLRVIRPLNLLIVLLTMLVVLFKYRNVSEVDYILKSFLLIIPAILTAAAGYIVNDIFDMETDTINKPGALFVGNSLKRRSAWAWYGLINLVSVFTSYFFSETYLVINLCIIVMLFLYSNTLKGIALIGNLFVAFCSASVIACCILLIAIQSKEAWVNFTGYTIFAFMISLIREVVKDIQDYEGDKAAGIRTFPVVAGIQPAKIFAYSLTGIQVVFCSLYSFLSWGLSMYAASLTMVAIAVVLLFSINLLARSKSREDYGRCSLLLKLVMLSGVVILIFA